LPKTGCMVGSAIVSQTGALEGVLARLDRGRGRYEENTDPQ
jgi:hypothetical protein